MFCLIYHCNNFSDFFLLFLEFLCRISIDIISIVLVFVGCTILSLERDYVLEI